MSEGVRLFRRRHAKRGWQSHPTRADLPTHFMLLLLVPTSAGLSRALTAPALPAAAAGWCECCQREHALPRTQAAERHARALLATIEAAGRFDFEADPGEPRFRTEACGSSGKMIGVLTCDDGTVLRAFSGLLGGSSRCTGWVGPVGLTLEDETASARFGRIVAAVRSAEVADPLLRAKRRRVHRELSSALAADLAASVVLRNWRGDVAPLPALLEGRRLPWGVGDCAAPKLLHAAHALGLRPTGLAEVWHEAPARRRSGADPSTARVRRRKHGAFFPACKERCEPIMGFLLCGLDEALY
jgi:hypothetical protein